MKKIQQAENAFSSDDLDDAHVYEESDSEYELDNRKIQQLVKESKRKPFVPGVSDAERLDESAQSALLGTLGNDLPERFGHLEEKMFYRPHDLNPGNPEYGFDEEPDTLTEEFVPDTDASKFDDDQQGLRHCAGKLQRRGKRLDAPLGCHLIDLDTVSPIDILGLKRFLSIDAEILSRTHTGLCAKCQRKVARTVKQSRSMGLLPHIGMLSLADAAPMKQNKPYHDVVTGGGKKNKPIMSHMVPIN
jgi:ribosomal protein S18